ncbi:hypothetical protein [Sphingobacterium sp.]|uniref:hypothetical protein n=1 Tax=Sphingobacterium sp. TaxID=341027 RepID=UPI002FDA9C51
MEINLVYAISREKLGNNSICEIIAFKTNSKEIVNDQQLIIKEFGNVRVFCPGADFNLFDILEIKYRDVTPNEVDGKLPVIQYNHPHGVTKAKLKYAIEIDSSYVLSDFLDLKKIVIHIGNGLLELLDGYFYFSSDKYIFGPFLYNSNRKEITCHGNIASKFKLESSNFVVHPNIGYNDLLILFKEPVERISEIDCSSNDQLINWLKDLFSKYPDSQEISQVLNKIRKRFADDQFNRMLNSIGISRYRRIKPLIEGISLDLEELNNLKKDESWVKVFNTALERYQNEFREQIETSFQERLREQNQHLTKISSEIEGKENEISRLQEAISLSMLDKQSLEEEIEHLTNNRQTIIQSLRLQLELTNLKQAHTQLYEVIELSNPSDIYYNDTSEVDYMDDLENLGVPRTEYLNQGIETLRSRKFILGYDINFTLTLIRSIGNAQIFLQQAEGDWLKFDKWYSNGLEDIINEAIRDSQTMYFYVLQDCNIAIPECYAKPIIDISRGIRKKVPGSKNQWPKNLWIVFIPLEADIDEFGFEINEETFKNWDKLPESKMKTIYELMLPKIWNLL